MAQVIKPPQPLPERFDSPSIFLAGSIDMGRAEAWQRQVEVVLADQDVVLLNPRRDDWDNSWVQSYQNPHFRAQVEWELEGLDKADLILVYFAPATQAPVSLLEMGLYARSGRMMIACPKGYWRRGNVEVVSKRFDIPLHPDLETALLVMRRWIQERNRLRASI